MEKMVDYLELLKRDYPEELQPGGMLESTLETFKYNEAHPEEWKQEATWVREAYKQNPQQAAAQYVWKLLRSFG